MERFTRRHFLGGAAALLGVGLATGGFVATRGGAAPEARATASPIGQASPPPVPALSGAGERVLVVLQLSGGNDGLNTVVPASASLYRQYAAARPRLKLPPRDLLTLDSGGRGAEVGLHPALRPLMAHWGRGECAIIQNVGYPKPNYSHFRSLAIWQTADPVSANGAGWLAHALEHQEHSPALIAASLGLAVPRALTGRAPLGISLDDLEEFQLAPIVGDVDADAVRALVAHLGGAYPDGSPRAWAAQALALTVDAAQRVAAATRAYTPAVGYPETELARRLRLAAQLIDARLGGRVYYVAMDGFDTHENQRGGDGGHDALLRDLSQAVDAFLADLRAHGHGDRVLLATFSEFGRRVAENGSGGTDHGSAGPMLLLGRPVAGGLYGAAPVLDPDLLIDDGNLPVAVDFRSVYATLLDRWLGVPPAAVLGADFAQLPVLRAS